ncbi:hypothetical protein V6N13_064279 [Hibiscus sabdariffa]
MVKFAKEELKVDVSMGVCRRARELAKEEIIGNYRHEFKRLFDYANALRRVDRDGTIDLLVERPTPNHRPRFKRFYGMLAGVLLVAAGKDANNQMYPTAWALVECETKHSWEWFLENLKKDFHMMNGERFTVMSDMQKGLIEEVASVLPEAEHKFCARHWFAIWKRLHTTLELHKLFMSCSKETSEAEFIKKQDNVTSGIESVTQPAAQPESVNQPVAQPESVTQEPVQHEIVDTIFDVPLNCSSGSQVSVSPSVVRPESRGRTIMEKNQGPKMQATRTTDQTNTSKRSTRNQAQSAPTPTLPTPPLYTQELRAYLMELGSKRSSMECDDVPNTQESTTAAKKQKKGKQAMTTSKKK